MKYDTVFCGHNTTLRRFKPVAGHPSLSRDEVHIGRLKDLKFSKAAFHLGLAVGSFTVTDTLLTDGKDALTLIIPGGYLIVVDTVFDTIFGRGKEFIELAQNNNFLFEGFRVPYHSLSYIFYKKQK